MGGAVAAAVGMLASAGAIEVAWAIGLGGTYFGVAFVAGVGLAANHVTGMLLGGSSKSKSSSLGAEAQDRKLTLRSSVEPRKLIYGLVKVSGPLALKATTGTTKEYLHLGVPLATREVAEIGDVWFDDTLSTDSRISGFNRVKKHLGAPSQEADTDLVAEVPGWTAQHRGRGIAYLYARAKYDSTAWPNSVKSVLGLLRGHYLYDPRAATVAITSSTAASPAVITTGAAHGLSVGDWIFVRGHSAALTKFYVVGTVPTTTSLTLLDPVTGEAVALAAGGTGGTLAKMAWSHNAALCILDYLLWTDGLNANEDEVHWDSWIASANVCEEQVELGATATLTANAGTDVVTLSEPVPWATGLSVRLTSTGTLPAPLAAETTYYWIRLSALTGKLAATSEDAGYGLGIDITDAGSGTHTLSCALTATVDATADTVTAASPVYWHTGDGVRFLSGTPPTGLSLGTTYFWVRTGDSAGKLASSFALAMAGTALDLADAGTGLTIARVSQPRYTCNGVVDLGKKPIDIMEQLLTSCLGVMPYLQGKYRLHAACAGVPLDRALTESDLRDTLKIRPRPPKRELYNAVRGTFVDPAQLWQPTDFVPQLSAGYEARDGGERIYKDKELPFTTDGTMAQRLARIDLARADQGITVDYPANLAALPIALWDVVPLSIANLGWVRKSFRVLGWTLSEQGGVDLVLQEEAPESYNDNPGEGTQADPAPNTLLANPWDVAAPTALTLASGTDVLAIRGDGTVQTRLKCAWTAPADAFVLSGGHIEIQQKKSADSAWLAAMTLPGADTEAYLLDVEDGTAYDVRLRATNGLGAASAWLAVTGHVVLGKSQPPSDVTGLSAQQNGINGTYQWTACTDLDFAGIELRYLPRIVVPAVFDWDAATLITKATRGTLITNSAVPPGLWTVGAKNLDTSGNYSLNVATCDLAMTNANAIILERQQAPVWDGGLTNLVRHHTGVLIPESQLTSVEDPWEEFVPSPFAICIYELEEIDLGFDQDGVRVWVTPQTHLGPGETTAAPVSVEIDYRLEADEYTGFRPWAVGVISARRIKARLVVDTSAGVPVIAGLLPTVDVQTRTEQHSVNVAPGGTTVTFAQRFNQPPVPTVNAIGTTGLAAVPSQPTTTECVVRVFDVATGAEITGTVPAAATFTGA
ncbi:MAG: phage tail protein [Humidesulfovibrio sp.]